ncbi:hypothetical protein VTH82DRAFT_6865 [Thermothelomyces myriococcoides]
MYRTTLRILTAAAPSIETLTFSLKYCPLVARHFAWAAHRVRFSHLTKLTLWCLYAARTAFRQFLLSASPTLKWFKFGLVALLPGDTPMGEPASTHFAEREEDKGIWKEMWNFFRDNFALEFLHFSFLGGPSGAVRVVDRLHGPEGSNPLTTSTNVAIFDAAKAKASFDQWIDQVDFGEDDDDTQANEVS